MRERVVTANGIRFSLLEEGPTDGPLALCLHGFPDTAHTWRHLAPALADAGYRAVAPFLRGYAPSDPAADGDYRTVALARDANALHAVLGGDGDAVIIGHDWGALTTYDALGLEPDRWRRAVAAGAPPIAALAEGFFAYDQLRRSWYTFLFQSPLAEMAVALEDYRFIDRLWADWSPRYDASFDVARVKESIGTEERIAAAIGYYRAQQGAGPILAEAQPPVLHASTTPTLYLHGLGDGCVGIDAVGDPVAHLAAGSEFVAVPDVGHFLHLEQPDVFAAHVLRFLSA